MCGQGRQGWTALPAKAVLHTALKKGFAFNWYTRGGKDGGSMVEATVSITCFHKNPPPRSPSNFPERERFARAGSFHSRP